MMSKPMLMVSIKRVSLSSQDSAASTNDQSIQERYRPNSDLRLARKSRLETDLLLVPILEGLVLGHAERGQCLYGPVIGHVGHFIGLRSGRLSLVC